MPHRCPCNDAINLLDALTGELLEGKLEASARVGMDLVSIKQLMLQLKDELKILRRKRR